MPTERDAKEIVTDDTDECHCGDYRIQHREGSGPCQICSWNHAPGMDPCLKFRLSRAARIKASETEPTGEHPNEQTQA